MITSYDDGIFERLCADWPEMRLERDATGEIHMMSPAGGRSGDRNSELGYQLRAWVKAGGVGKCFDSSTGFRLPNGATRSPDASWIAPGRWDALTPREQEGFPPTCPDFVVELRSPSDRLPRLREKMAEYVDQGARLGWLIDPERRVVEVYRPGRDPETLDAPATLPGEDVLPGFVLDLKDIL